MARPARDAGHASLSTLSELGVAESGESRVVESLVHPVRDLFVAIFFVSVGMLIDPRALAERWVSVLVLAHRRSSPRCRKARRTRRRRPS